MNRRNFFKSIAGVICGILGIKALTEKPEAASRWPKYYGNDMMTFTDDFGNTTSVYIISWHDGKIVDFYDAKFGVPFARIEI